MPSFVNSPFVRPQLAMKGVPAYLFGSFDPRIGNTNLYLTNSALTTNVATLTVQLLNGPLPAVGNYISVVNSTAGSAALNVNRAVITGVTINATTGAGTITFALSNANITSVADTGSVIVEPSEVPETLAAGASQAVIIQAPEGDSQFTVPFAVTFTTLPTAVTVTLQQAINANSNEWTNTTTVATVAGGVYTAGSVVSATLQRGYAYRAFVSGLTLGSGVGLVVKIGG
jgi:hypothetical protein